MLKARSQFSEMLDFVIVRDFEQLNDTPDLGIFDEAVKGVDGIIHTASVLLPTFYPWMSLAPSKC
jgi:hypothetical protein